MQADGSGAHRIGDPLPSGLATGSGSWGPQWSSDSARIAFDASNGITDSALYVVNLATGRQVRLGADLRAAFAPFWGPGPTDLAFEDRNGSVPGKIDVYVSNPDAGTARLLLPNADLWGWAPDGASLLIGRPSCWSDNNGMTTPCANGVFSLSLDGSVQRELVSATQLARLAPYVQTAVKVGVEAAAWRPVRP
jgi:Tol biopolymer transport system component